jgi:hypothetical protein
MANYGLPNPAESDGEDELDLKLMIEVMNQNQGGDRVGADELHPTYHFFWFQ